MRSVYAYYGDWVPPPPASKASNSFVSSFSLVYTNQLLLGLARALKSNQTEFLSKQLSKLLEEFQAAWFNNHTNAYDIGVQTTYVLPMALEGLVPYNVALGLLDEIEKTNYHLDTGIVGLRFLFESLVRMGSPDVALEIVNQQTYPGYAYEWNNGIETPATTLWELWDAPLEGPGMNSRNHIMDGSVDTFIQTHAGGVTQHPDSVAHRHIVIRPTVAAFHSPVRDASLNKELPRGVVKSEWQRNGGLVCEKAAAGDPLILSCGVDGGVLSEIEWASAGVPSGTCDRYRAHPSCHANSSLLHAISSRCLGKSRCQIDQWWSSSDVQHLEDDRRVNGVTGGIATHDFVDSPLHCTGQSHIVAAIRARCSKPTHYRLSVELPAHTAGDVYIPRFAIVNPRAELHTNAVIDKAGAQETTDFIFLPLRPSPNVTHLRVVISDASEGPPQSVPLVHAIEGSTKGVIGSFDRLEGLTLSQGASLKHACVGQHPRLSKPCREALQQALKAAKDATPTVLFVDPTSSLIWLTEP
jgi:hypothetical protein